jgi:hypothetical protein
MKGQAICKDCGNGTLNNELNEQFVQKYNERIKEWFVACRRCGSSHIDGQLEAA